MKKKLFPLPLPVHITLFYSLAVISTILSLKFFPLLTIPFFISGILAYLFNPIVNMVTGKTGISRAFASAIIIALLLVIFFLVNILLLPYIVEQIINLGQKLPDLLYKFSNTVKGFSDYLTRTFPDFAGDINLMKDIENLISRIPTGLSEIITDIFSSIYGSVIVILYLVFIPVFTYYFLKDYYKIYDSLIDLVPYRYRNGLKKRIFELNSILSSFIRGQAIVVVILSVLYSTGLTIIGLPFGIIIGIIAGLGDMIPYTGTIIGMSISLIIAAAHFQAIQPTLLIVVLFLVIKLFENWYLYPRIVGREVGMHFLMVLISIILFGTVFGFWGLLLAIPSVAGFKMFLKDCIEYYKKTGYYRDQ